METYFTEGDLPGEIWKPVVLPEWYKSKVNAYHVSKSYMVSNMGRVKSTTRKVFVTNGNRKKNFWEYPWYTHLGQLITPCMKYYVWLYSPGGKATYIPISVLVALAFIPNPNNYKYALPKDEDRGNCCDSNLYWSKSKCTESEKKKMSEVKKGKVAKAVYCVTNNTVYASVTEAGDKLGIDRGNIGWCCNGKNILPEYPDGHHYKKGRFKDSPVYEFWLLCEWEELYGPISK